MRAYLGSETTLHGYKLTRLATEEATDVKSYVAARWHHDRAGRRTKMFVFLHDIDCDEGHPTQVSCVLEIHSFHSGWVVFAKLFE